MWYVMVSQHLPPVIEDRAIIWGRVEQSVQQEMFTPFLGAGASSLRPEQLSEPPWDEVSERISLLRAALEREEDRQYLDSMARLHHIKIGDGQTFKPASSYDAALFNLQLALVRLGSHLIRVFGKEMVETGLCVTDVLDYRVPLSDNARPKVLELLFDVVDAARSVCQQAGSENREPGLDSNAIYERLLVLLCRICPQKVDHQCSKILDRCRAHYDEINALRQLTDLTTKETLRLDELSWLSDLLWYTLRYHVPAYPTTAELAFQLSLMIRVMKDPQLRRGELAQIAQLQANYEQQVEQIRKWFEFYEAGNPRPSDFHLGIAAVLQYQFERRGKKSGDLLPLAFTTNYDRALEKAFEHLGLSYHVVFPVAAWGSDDIMWVFKTFVPQGSTVAPSPRECREWESSVEGDCIRGPILIKLHGSPLEPLPDAKDIVPKAVSIRKLQHCIVLSESTYLATIVGQRAYPNWIERELKAPGRALWFLGYSLGDWNIRLRLYEHLLHTKESIHPQYQPPMRLAVDRRFDILRGAVLGPLQVTVYRTDLLAFSTELRMLPEVRRILDSRGLR